MSIAIVSDSACDLPKDILKKLNITEVPVNVTFGDKVYKENVDITGDEFYKKLTSSSDFPTTSQPSPGDFEKIYINLLKKYDEILSIHISSKVSGTYNSAIQAADKVGITYECLTSRIHKSKWSLKKALSMPQISKKL